MAGTAPRQGLNHVIGPNQSDPTQQTESKTKTELENLSLAEAGRRFTQAAKTPFLQPPLIGIFTEANLSTQAFDQVLDRTFECPEGLNEMMWCLLSALQHPPDIVPIQTRQLGDITAGWCKAREVTSSSPSLIHFGHYMASTFNPTIAVFNARLVNLGFTTGYSLKHWWTGLNIILEKQAGNFNDISRTSPMDRSNCRNQSR